MLVVLDTNVVVSGMLFAESLPGQVLEGLYTGDIVPLYDDRILEEYAEVLARSKFDIEREQAAWFFELLRFGVSVVAPPLPLTVPDPDDLKFIEVAVAGGADAIVTGKARHFRVAEGRLDMPVVSPRRMVEMLRGA